MSDKHRAARVKATALPVRFAIAIAGLFLIPLALARFMSFNGFAMLVLGAAISFTCGGIFMKLSEGLTRPGPTVLLFAFFALGAVLQTLAMRGEELGVTYIVVLGVEAILAFLFGLVLFGEVFTLVKVGGLIAIVIGIVALRL